MSPPPNLRKKWPVQQEALSIENTAATEAVIDVLHTSNQLDEYHFHVTILSNLKQYFVKKPNKTF